MRTSEGSKSPSQDQRARISRKYINSKTYLMSSSQPACANFLDVTNDLSFIASFTAEALFANWRLSLFENFNWHKNADGDRRPVNTTHTCEMCAFLKRIRLTGRRLENHMRCCLDSNLTNKNIRLVYVPSRHQERVG